MVSHASKCFLVTNHILWCQDENLCHQKVLFCSYNSLKLSILISSLSSNKQWRRQQGCWECQGTPGIWAFRKGTKPDFCLSGVQLSLKVAFFHKVQSVFSNLQTSKMKISQKTILSLKFKFPASYSTLLLAGNLNFKFRIVLWNIFFGDLKNTQHFLKKSHLYEHPRI